MEEKRIQEQKAAEQQRQQAEADLKQAEEEFQAAERRSGNADQNAAKGTLSGQVFVSTEGGENFKLGAVKVGLFARDAIDGLVAKLKKSADYKIQQLRGPVAEAKAAQDQAEASYTAASNAVTQAIRANKDYKAAEDAQGAALDAKFAASRRYSEMNEELSFCYSGGFYFGFLQSAIRTAETDAEGRFVIEVPRTGGFVIAAEGMRRVMEHTEHYYWLQPVSLEGQQQLTQNLSNNNLTNAAGSSSLIHTRD